jgi:S1-C subfamily serine protease
MDIEQLNKSQLVLLTLLVSFVTSLATGIVTITLMEQAPPAITQTVNRIVERTIEKVVPQDGQVAAAANVVTEKTVVVHESDQVTEAVAKASPIAVRLTAPSRDAEGYIVDVFLGLGVVASSDGLIFADATMMRDDADVTVTRNDGVKAKAKVVGRDTKTGIVRLKAATSTEIEIAGVKETRQVLIMKTSSLAAHSLLLMERYWV